MTDTEFVLLALMAVAGCMYILVQIYTGGRHR